MMTDEFPKFVSPMRDESLLSCQVDVDIYE